MSIQTTDNLFGYGSPRIVDAFVGRGTYTTIQAAINAAFSGQVVFINPGTYTETITLKAGVNLYGTTGVNIVGQLVANYTGSVSVFMVNMVTNGAPCINASGSGAMNLSLVRSTFSSTNASVISWTNSNASSIFNLATCVSSLTTTGFAHFTFTTGNLNISMSSLVNPGGSTTISSWSGAGLIMNTVTYESNIDLTGAGTALISNSSFSSINSVAVLIDNTGNNFIEFCKVSSGSAIPIFVNSGCTVSFAQGILNSAASALTSGTGTFKYGSITCEGTANTLGTTTNTPLTVL